MPLSPIASFVALIVQSPSTASTRSPSVLMPAAAAAGSQRRRRPAPTRAAAATVVGAAGGGRRGRREARATRLAAGSRWRPTSDDGGEGERRWPPTTATTVRRASRTRAGGGDRLAWLGARERSSASGDGEDGHTTAGRHRHPTQPHAGDDRPDGYPTTSAESRGIVDAAQFDPATLHVPFDRSRAARSPGPLRSTAWASWAPIADAYSGRSTSRKIAERGRRVVVGVQPGQGEGQARVVALGVVHEQGVLADVGDLDEAQLAVGAHHDAAVAVGSPKRIGWPWTRSIIISSRACFLVISLNWPSLNTLQFW